MWKMEGRRNTGQNDIQLNKWKPAKIWIKAQHAKKGRNSPYQG